MQHTRRTSQTAKDASALPVTWRKSSHSNGQSACVEVASNLLGVVPVRDSKTPSGPQLLFGAPSWRAFVSTCETTAAVQWQTG
ncbi:DUF397 domain-containing protein [Streptomyces sp. NPDC049879]|uniref:DUF397 domain-containing protein n=1 Tax=Streptomyces sp. NPDC049879 TaxID=3365598 RepID=UPI00379C1BD0